MIREELEETTRVVNAAHDLHVGLVTDDVLWERRGLLAKLVRGDRPPAGGGGPKRAATRARPEGSAARPPAVCPRGLRRSPGAAK